MSFGTGNVDPGTNQTLQVASDVIAGIQYQRTKFANPNADQTGAYGIDTDPVRVRPRRRGTSDYDSGIFAVTNGAPTLITATTIYPEGGTITNTTTSARKLTITDGADTVLEILNLQPEETRELPVPLSGAWAGLKIGADGAGVRAQVAGGQ